MQSTRILWAQFFAALLLAILAWTAIENSLYWYWWWFDIPMHILGGIWAGLCAAWIVAHRGNTFTLVGCLAFALFVGVSWETFEYVEKIAVVRENYFFDTATDIVMDFAGAVLGYGIARVLIKRKERVGTKVV